MAQELDRSAQIISLVLDRVQVVSYKWLSREFSITSNEAKRLLQMIVDQHGSTIEVIYVVSGWLKKNQQYHSVQLVPKSKLQEAKDLLVGHISIHVYSIQSSIPQDPADLWAAEYVQSQELFKQLPELDNCLCDNRFSAIACSSLSRKISGKSEAATKSAANSGSLYKCTEKKTQVLAQPPATLKVQDATTPAEKQNLKPIEGEDISDKQGKSDLKAPKAASHALVNVVPNKEVKKETVDSSGGGALANLWGRASTKIVPVETHVEIAKTKAAPAEPRVETRMEKAGISLAKPLQHDSDFSRSCDDDDDATDFMHVRRGIVKNNRKMRRMIIDDDLSDEEQDDSDKNKLDSGLSPVVEPISVSSVCDEKSWDVMMEKRKKSTPANGVARESPENASQSTKSGCRTVDSSTIENAGYNSKIKEVRDIDRNLVKDISDKIVGSEVSKEEPMTKNIASSGVVSASKKRKVLKTHIDDHGREVTEVVWENDNIDLSDGKVHTNGNTLAQGDLSMKASDIKLSGNKPQKVSNKSNNSKSASKESQKGKISSFFKRTT